MSEAKEAKVPRKSNVGQDIIEGLKWALRHARGENPPGGRVTTVWVDVPDVRRIRRKQKLSQSEFALRYGLNVRTVQQWEQGRAVPDQPARVLLNVIASEPKAVERVVRKCAA